MDNFSFLNTAHASFFADLYDQYLQDPDSLEPSWKAFFQGYDFANSDFLQKELVEGVSPQVPEKVLKEFRVINLINYYTQLAFKKLDNLNIRDNKKDFLFDFGNSLMKRKI